MHSYNTLLRTPAIGVRLAHGPETVLLSLSPLWHLIAWVGIDPVAVIGGRFVTDDRRPL